LIHLNKCPIVAPAKTLLPENAERLNIPRELCLENLKSLKQHTELRDKLTDVFASNDFGDEPVEAEFALYGGKFFSHGDKAQMDILHQLTPEQLGTHPFQFQDGRLNTLLFSYRARNFPYTLDDGEQQKWQAHCQNRLQYGTKNLLSADKYMMKLENLAFEHENNTEKMQLLKVLFEYINK
jgi:exodeoxyribonuclease-1